MKVDTQSQFGEFVKSIQAKGNYRNPIAFAFCRVQRSQLDKNKILDATSLFINWHKDEKPNNGSAALFLELLGVLEHTNLKEVSELVLDLNADFVQAAYKAFTPYHEESVGVDHQNAQAIMGLNNDGRPWGHLESGFLYDPDVENFQLVFLFDDVAPQSTSAVHLKLELMSRLKAKPHTLNLDGMFAHLPTVAWEGNKAYDEDYLRQNEMLLKLNDVYPAITSWDKFPAMSHKIPLAKSVRIADTSRVRLGAYIGEGTVVMHEGFCNFNAGTEGPGMIEGRISAGVFVGAGSDLGGGCSTMGTLSGGNDVVISVGAKCLAGANAGIGIPLGDGCVVEAGLYVTAGSKVVIPNDHITQLQNANPGREFIPAYGAQGACVVAARELSGFNNVMFRRNSQNGQMEALFTEMQVKLNADLHSDTVKEAETAE